MSETASVIVLLIISVVVVVTNAFIMMFFLKKLKGIRDAFMNRHVVPKKTVEGSK